MANIDMLRKMVEDTSINDGEFIGFLVGQLIECMEHDEEMTNRCNLLSVLWQAYRDSIIEKKSVYIDLVEVVLKADRKTITRFIKDNTIEKGE